MDFNLPQRFDVNYIGEDGQEHMVAMVHRTVLGSMERFLASLIEHYGGAFPVWLAPVQVVVIPIADRHLDYARKLEAELKKRGGAGGGGRPLGEGEHEDTAGAAGEGALHAGRRG